MKNYYKGNEDQPYHLSVGAVAVNDKGEICCHYHKQMLFRGVPKDFTDFYILMRETIEIGESLEDTLHRGLMEEFGVTGDIITYLGSIKGHYPINNISIEKTTIYFLVKTKTFDLTQRSEEDIKGQSEVQWQTPDFLIAKMKDQRQRLGEESLDESLIIERARKYINA